MLQDIVLGTLLGLGVSLLVKFLQGGICFCVNADAYEDDIDAKLKGLVFNSSDLSGQGF